MRNVRDLPFSHMPVGEATPLQAPAPRQRNMNAGGTGPTVSTPVPTTPVQAPQVGGGRSGVGRMEKIGQRLSGMERGKSRPGPVMLPRNRPAAGGYDSSGINPGAGRPRVPSTGGKLPPQRSGGYDGSGINPGANRPSPRANKSMLGGFMSRLGKGKLR